VVKGGERGRKTITICLKLLGKRLGSKREKAEPKDGEVVAAKEL